MRGRSGLDDVRDRVKPFSVQISEYVRHKGRLVEADFKDVDEILVKVYLQGYGDRKDKEKSMNADTDMLDKELPEEPPKTYRVDERTRYESKVIMKTEGKGMDEFNAISEFYRRVGEKTLEHNILPESKKHDGLVGGVVASALFFFDDEVRLEILLVREDMERMA